MRLGELLLLYLVVGSGCAIAVWRTWPRRGGRAFAAAAMAVPFWPLWAPVALGRAATPRRAAAVPAAPDDVIARIDVALEEGLAAVEGSALTAMLTPDSASRIRAQVARASRRHAELAAIVARAAFDPIAAEARVAELERGGGSARALATARAHLANVERLRALRDRDARALDELEDAIGALRTQLVLARYAGSSPEGVGAIVADVWARVEGLGAAIELEDARAPDEGHG